MKPFTILLDMDGVIANLLRAMCMAHRKRYNPKQVTSFRIEENWSISKNALWKPCNSIEFWENIPTYEWTTELIQELCRLAPVIICTAPSKSEFCIPGKVKWLQKYTNFVETNNVVFASKKYLLSRPNSILIDDKQSNIDAFNEGLGTGIVFPQPWNKGKGDYYTVLEKADRAICNYERSSHYFSV